MTDYDRIARAIAYLEANVSAQPQLDDVARHVHLSPFHFQRLFTRWAGTTPKRFLQVLTLELGKQLLQQDRSLLDVSDKLGLSSSSRLHDHFVQIEAVTPGEFRSQGAGLAITYGVAESPFGLLFAARTPRGICRCAFIDDKDAIDDQLASLQTAWPLASYRRDNAVASDLAGLITALPDKAPKPPLPLHISGTNFQLAVWRALLQIPSGTAVSYGDIAAQVGSPKAVRAVGTAVGANPVALLIPCHRVIQQSGALGGYRWGLTRKVAIQAWERL
ncbi:MAG TPA: methylated-DNA--[protein]-cysteine S-methyltransferase [Candidatus Acidoferrum sp.]|nr:methylated-DNA--[protein]-cysteine S-methyltransferase [Candidatus Acidoferrum sp.]